MSRNATLLFLCLATVVAADKVLEPTKPDAARRIVSDALTNQPIHDSRLDGKLVLTDAQGAKKELRVVILARPKENTAYTIIRVTAPSEVVGAAVMVIHSFDLPSHVFYRAPNAAEAVEVTGEKGREHFLDTDLSYEDVNFAFLRWKNQETLREAKRLERECYVIKSIPAPEDHSQYAHVVSWIDKEANAPLVAEGYDTRGKLIKTMTVKGFLRSGGGWTIKEMVIEDKLREHNTKLIIEKGDFHIEHPADLFTKEKFFR